MKYISVTATERIKDYFGLKRNVAILAIAIFLLSLGEELWSSYIPEYLKEYLKTLGTTVIVVGVYGAFKDFLDAIYQYPGGRLADKIGRKNSLLLFTTLALIGYLIYFFTETWVLVIFGTFFVMAWSSFSLPAIFATVGDSLPEERRSIAFAVQSILKRLPIVLAPPIGGLLILRFGEIQGVKHALLATIFLAIITIILLYLFYKEGKTEEKMKFKGAKRLFKEFNPQLKLLLSSDILIRLCEGVPANFLILYVIEIMHIDYFHFGLLISIQMATSLLVYIPIAKLSDRIGRMPFIALTFFFFTLFPLTVVLSKDFVWLVFAFVVGGLREIGEPARKAMIVDLAPKEERGSSIGLYYLFRGLSVAPASLLGSLLWLILPQSLFFIAFLIGVVGTISFVMLVKQ